VTVVAHVAGLPVEELAAAAAGAGTSLAVARAWLAAHLRRRPAPTRRSATTGQQR
jgi:hypothetical protein